MSRIIKKGDIIIILIMSLFSILLLYESFTYEGERYACIYENGELTHTVELRKEDDYEIEINGGRLKVSGGTICYTASDCPDGTCRSFGELSRVGDTASCVPNKTVVIITGEDKNSADAMTY